MTGLESETLTFLFTDIEGSTRLWEAYPEAMETALARHDALMRQAIEASGGSVFKTVGDAFCAVFVEPAAVIATAVALLQQPETRLVTLTGPGGTGKTRLALQIGAELMDEFADGVFFVSLAPERQPALAMATIARTLGIRESRNLPLVDGLTAYLRDKQLLLVLDNFEQLLPAAPELVTLLEAAPGLKMIVTSRAALRVSGEHVFPVEPLPTPQRAETATVADVARSPAVDLFVQQAGAAQPSFNLTEQNAADVAAICARLDGLPLAIELAAAKIQLLSPNALLARLDRGLGLLAAGARDLPPRHQTMRGAIAWSFDLLPPPLQQLFCRLTIFAGGFTLDAADHIDARRRLDNAAGASGHAGYV